MLPFFSRNYLFREVFIGAVSVDGWFEGAVLLDTASEWTIFVEDEFCSAFIVKSTHVFSSFICVFDVRLVFEAGSMSLS